MSSLTPSPIITLAMVREYIFLAASCVAVGIIITFLVLGICVRLGIDLNKNFWVLAIPALLAVILNISLIELYRKYKGRK